MRIIGLTGGIASGKSTVARMMERLGAAVIDADQLARDAVIPGTPAHAAILKTFGPGVFAPDGTINRAALGDLVFANPDARRRLEEITHPEIGRLAEQRLEELRKRGVAVAVYMAPLLIEAGLTGRVDDVWVVYLDREAQLSRLMQRDGISMDDAVRRIESQMPMDEKRRHGKVVIDNSGRLEDTECRLREAWEMYVAGLEKRDE